MIQVKLFDWDTNQVSDHENEINEWLKSQPEELELIELKQTPYTYRDGDSGKESWVLTTLVCRMPGPRA